MWGNICKTEVDENGTWKCFPRKYFRLCFHVVNFQSLEKSKHDCIKCTLIWANVLAPVVLSAPNLKYGKKRNANADPDFDFSFLFPNKSFSACIPMLDINILVDNPMETAKFIDTFLWLDVKRDMSFSYFQSLCM